MGLDQDIFRGLFDPTFFGFFVKQKSSTRFLWGSVDKMDIDEEKNKMERDLG